MELSRNINPLLRQYVEDAVLPRYDSFDKGHQRDHADAAEDHKASSDYEPRTVYGKIIAEADRQIVPEVVIRRTVQYGLKNYPEKDKEALRKAFGTIYKKETECSL